MKFASQQDFHFNNCTEAGSPQASRQTESALLHSDLLGLINFNLVCVNTNNARDVTAVNFIKEGVQPFQRLMINRQIITFINQVNVYVHYVYKVCLLILQTS